MADPEVEPVLRGRHARLPQPVARLARAGLQAGRAGGGAPLHLPVLRADPRQRAARRLADREPRRPAGLPAVEAYEAALANIGPELVRRPDPESVEEVLAWAGMPVATAEVAAVCDREVADVRTELARVGTFLPVGGDGYWTAAA